MTQMNVRETRRFAWACTLATLVATAAVLHADTPVHYDLGPFLKWCETASSAAYILAGCWLY